MIVNAEVDKSTKVWQPDLVNFYSCKIGKNCNIAAFVEIGEDVVIGDRCKIQAFSFIPSGVTIGNDVFIGPNVVFTNDKYPPSHGDWKRTIVEDGVAIGAGARILPGITIGKNSLVGVGAVVTKDVEESSVVIGIPATERVGGLHFGLIGDGRVAKYHREAIERIGGEIVSVYDPILHPQVQKLSTEFFNGLNYVVICSPSMNHYEHIKIALRYNVKIIVEKPMVLPWEPIIDNDDIFIVMQLRWLENFDHINKIRLKAVRDNEYFDGWRGDPEKTGGLFFDLFIHYIDLAMSYNATFEAVVSSEGTQERWLDDLDLFSIDMNDCYERMYKDIVFRNRGVKPTDIAFLYWMLSKYSVKYGTGKDILDKPIKIDFSSNKDV